MSRSLFRLSVLCVVLALAACAPKIAHRGQLIEPDKLAEVKVGTSNREDVATKLGSPTQVGTFNENLWYYYGRQTEQYSFLDPEIVEQQAIEIRFDDAGTVTAVTKLDTSKARNDISPVERQTPTYGHETSIIEDLVGNLGHPGMPMKNQK